MMDRLDRSSFTTPRLYWKFGERGVDKIVSVWVCWVGGSAEIFASNLLNLPFQSAALSKNLRPKQHCTQLTEHLSRVRGHNACLCFWEPKPDRSILFGQRVVFRRLWASLPSGKAATWFLFMWPHVVTQTLFVRKDTTRIGIPDFAVSKMITAPVSLWDIVSIKQTFYPQSWQVLTSPEHFQNGTTVKLQLAHQSLDLESQLPLSGWTQTVTLEETSGTKALLLASPSFCPSLNTQRCHHSDGLFIPYY